MAKKIFVIAPVPKTGDKEKDGILAWVARILLVFQLRGRQAPEPLEGAEGLVPPPKDE